MLCSSRYVAGGREFSLFLPASSPPLRKSDRRG
jgi:hypothetical protein